MKVLLRTLKNWTSCPKYIDFQLICDFITGGGGRRGSIDRALASGGVPASQVRFLAYILSGCMFSSPY